MGRGRSGGAEQKPIASPSGVKVGAENTQSFSPHAPATFVCGPWGANLLIDLLGPSGPSQCVCVCVLQTDPREQLRGNQLVWLSLGSIGATSTMRGNPCSGLHCCFSVLSATCGLCWTACPAALTCRLGLRNCADSHRTALPGMICMHRLAEIAQVRPNSGPIQCTSSPHLPSLEVDDLASTSPDLPCLHLSRQL